MTERFNEFMSTYISDKQQSLLNEGGSLAVLTPDDILTLRLLQTNWIRIRMSKNTDKRLDYDFDKALETLNRILKQVG